MSPDDLSPEQQRLKDSFIQKRDYWHPAFDTLLQYDVEFFEAYANLSARTFEDGVLDPKLREYVLIVMNSTPAIRMSDEEMRKHIRAALKQGGTFGEILELFKLVSVVGIHSVSEGSPLLSEVLDEDSETDLSDPKRRVKRDFELRRGYWSEELWEPLLYFDHEFLAAYTDFSANSAETGHLNKKERELVFIALDVGVPHLYLEGLQTHIENALKYGA